MSDVYVTIKFKMLLKSVQVHKNHRFVFTSPFRLDFNIYIETDKVNWMWIIEYSGLQSIGVICPLIMRNNSKI